MYQCSTCERQPHYRQLLGHDGRPTGFWDNNLITEAPLDRCPVRSLQLAPAALVDEVHRYVNTYYPAYQDGFLLEAGGIAEQPARYLELIQLTRAFDRRVQQKYDTLTAETPHS